MGSIYSFEYKQTLKIQKRVARIILNANMMTSSEQMFSELKWLSFPQRLPYHTSIVMFKALSNIAEHVPKDVRYT